MNFLRKEDRLAAEKQLQESLDKLKEEPLYNEFMKKSFKDILMFGENTPETIELEAKLVKSWKDKL